MMSAKENELITRIGPGTPCGKLMRRYWQPAALVDELDGPRPVKPVRLLGENLVLFRDEQGRYGLLDRHCPHRGADLAFGRREDGGLRCSFHGWLFDVTGQCLETPAEPVNSPLCRNIKQPAYPVVERSGVLWAYMGPGEAPAFPSLRLLRGAGRLHLRVQGAVGVQLAAGAGGRHRPRARLIPASVLRGRGPHQGLRQAVPRCVHGQRHADDPGDARARPAHHRGGAYRLWPQDLHHARPRQRQDARARHQPDLPARHLHSAEPGDDAHPVAHAGR